MKKNNSAIARILRVIILLASCHNTTKYILTELNKFRIKIKSLFLQQNKILWKLLSEQMTEAFLIHL